MDYGRDGLKHVPNPNRRSKGYAKQSKFEGSNRYIRAQILKYILANKKATKEELFALLTDNPHIKDLSSKKYTEILAKLHKDTTLRRKGKFYMV